MPTRHRLLRRLDDLVVFVFGVRWLEQRVHELLVSSSGGTNACEIAPGKYTVTSKRSAGDPTKCPAPAPQTVEIKEGDGGTNHADAGSSYQVTLDNANCSSVIECKFSQSGFTTRRRRRSARRR